MAEVIIAPKCFVSVSVAQLNTSLRCRCVLRSVKVNSLAYCEIISLLSRAWSEAARYFNFAAERSLCCEKDIPPQQRKSTLLRRLAEPTEVLLMSRSDDEGSTMKLIAVQEVLVTLNTDGHPRTALHFTLKVKACWQRFGVLQYCTVLEIFCTLVTRRLTDYDEWSSIRMILRSDPRRRAVEENFTFAVSYIRCGFLLSVAEKWRGYPSHASVLRRVEILS